MNKLCLPEINVDRPSIVAYINSLSEHSWRKLSDAHSYHDNWMSHPEYKRLQDKYCVGIPHHLSIVRFNPGGNQGIHKDSTRYAVIQYPLSENCRTTPTPFYNDQHELIDQIDWDDRAWLFNAHVWHGSHNTDSNYRYMLTWSFFRVDYQYLTTAYEEGRLC